MNFAERLTAGPPVLATVGRRAQVGDVVVLSPEVEPHEHSEEALEVIETRPAIVGGAPGLVLRSLVDGCEAEAAYRAVRVLTKVEAKAAREHYADVLANQ